MAAANHDIVAALYEGALDDTRLQSALAQLARHFDSTSIALLSLDTHLPTANTWATSGALADAKALAAYQTEFGVLDPAPRAFATSPALLATTTGRLIAEGRIDVEDRGTRVFLNEFFRPIGLEECLGANLSFRDGHTGLIGIQRGGDRGPYGQDDVRALNAILPHLARALHLRRDLAELSIKSSLFVSFIDRLTAGVVILDPAGRALHCNRALREMAARADGLSLNRQGMPFGRGVSGRREIERLCASVRGGGAGGVARLERRDSGQPYAIHVVPLHSRSIPGLRQLDVPYTLMIIHDPEANVDSPLDIIATAFGLPLRTAELVLALSQGEAPNEFAERRGISINAVKYHLKTAFARTGFRRQSELSKAVARALAELGRRMGKG